MTACPELADAFHELHRDFLILPNAWDAISAKIVESAGAKAVATSSAAVAWAHGHADGHDLPFETLLAAIKEIVRVAKGPVSADIEGGYSDDPAVVAVNVAALIDVGVAGINLEDGAAPHDLHLRKIDAARSAAEHAGVNLFINARTDVYLKQLVSPEEVVDDTIRRGLACAHAGASGLFAPLLTRPVDIRAIVGAVPLPLNVIAWPGAPDAAALRELGVRRLSAGTRIATAALRAVREATTAFLAGGDSEALAARTGEAVNYNALIKG